MSFASEKTAFGLRCRYRLARKNIPEKKLCENILQVCNSHCMNSHIDLWMSKFGPYFIFSYGCVKFATPKALFSVT